MKINRQNSAKKEKYSTKPFQVMSVYMIQMRKQQKKKSVYFCDEIVNKWDNNCDANTRTKINMKK